MKGNNEQIIFSCQQPLTTAIFSLVDTGRKLNVHKTFKRRHGYLLSVLCTFNLRPVSTGSDLLDLPNYFFFYLLKNQSDLNAKNIFDCGIVEQFSRQITYVVNSSEIFM